MPSHRTTHLLYLHGFRSSPASTKARLLCRAVQQQPQRLLWWSPQLPPSPAAAAQLIDHGTRDWPRDSMAVVGSSLGGFYAHWLATRRRCRAVFLNPAVHPARDLASQVGRLSLWHAPDQFLDFLPPYLDELRDLQVTPGPPAAPQLAVIAKGDEVLDWREMAARYAGCRQRIIEGGDHGISDFERWMPEVLSFALDN